MGEIISIIDFIINNIKYLTFTLMGLGLILSIIILFAEYKTKVIYYCIHPRNKVWFMLVIVFAVIIFAVTKECKIPQWLVYTALSLWFVFLVYSILRVSPNKHYFNIILAFLHKKIEKGFAFEYSNYFSKERHWYFLSKTSKIDYKLLRAAFFFELREYKKAYVSLLNIKDKDLYENELEEHKYQKAMILCFLGSINSALELLGDPEQNQSNNPFVWEAYSYCYELQTNLELSYKYIQKAKSLVDTQKIAESTKAEIYNNAGRISLLRNNQQEALQYFRTAYQKTKQSKDNRELYPILHNLIVNVAQFEKDKDKCLKLLAEYKQALEFDTVKNLNEYYNLVLIVYRQFSDNAAIYKIIMETYGALIKKLQGVNAEIFKVSNLRILLNGKFNYSWIDKEILLNHDLYQKLNFYDKMLLNREYMGLFSQESFRFLLQKEPYKSIYSFILSYYQNLAIQEIDEELNHVEPYEIFKYKNLMMYKLDILKLINKEKHIENSKDIYLELYDTIKKAGCSIDATNVMLTFLDECTSPYNQIIIGQNFKMYYYMFLNSYPSMEPAIASNGIHILIENYEPNLDILQLHPLKIDLIEKYINIPYRDILSWFSHPAKYEMSVKVCSILLGLNKIDEARRMYDIFKSSKQSLNSYALLFQLEINQIENYFKNLSKE